MSLNEIILSTRLLVDLYPNVLIESYATHVPEKLSPQYIGKNKKHILIIISKDDPSIISKSEMSFLNNVLTACKLGVDDVAIINEPLADSNYKKLLESLEPKTILLFNLDPISFGLPINFPHFQVQTHNKKTYLYAPSLIEIENNIDLKKQLWGSLKLLFSI